MAGDPYGIYNIATHEKVAEIMFDINNFESISTCKCNITLKEPQIK